MLLPSAWLIFWINATVSGLTLNDKFAVPPLRRKYRPSRRSISAFRHGATSIHFHHIITEVVRQRLASRLIIAVIWEDRIAESSGKLSPRLASPRLA